LGRRGAAGQRERSCAENWKILGAVFGGNILPERLAIPNQRGIM